MLDIKKTGVIIASLRKKNGLSQERLAEMLCISPQAISKWENGHSLPETSLLPVLCQIFGCTIDELIMPAYSFDPKLEEEKPNILQMQAEQVAKYVIQQLGNTAASEQIIGLDDNTIIHSIKKTNPNIGNCTVTRGKPEENSKYTIIYITVVSPQKEFKLIEKIYSDDDKELYGYSFFSQYTSTIPLTYHIDPQKRIILMEDLTDYIQGFHFDEANEYGNKIRENYYALLKETAKLHATFWENRNALEKVGLHYRHETKENLLAHINGMEADYLKYRKDEECGKIPKVWDVHKNNIAAEKLNLFQDAIKLLKQEYLTYVDTRFHSEKNITIIHGDMHPGNIFLSKSNNNEVKFIDLEAVRVGLCTEDLAMLLALHIEPDKKYAKQLIDYYYNCLCENIKEYPYETFIKDYKISIMENMFFAIRLLNSGIYDFTMRDKAIKSFETFVLDKE
ncbi:helix-turn-helix domain-containing protein [Clostridium sp. YIM B02505]|uniref:Helix-turn-helix domain-containing protein n=1 Tax=Clostridium yunnanense TaxID=2800325 RepID=A0ABS1ESF4_9CLOT|nr:helix-turn-helix domain-containing protein [Clostridium yunnanense]MBK1812255.1 helix-turn-helix domain-containing protein [Clostridium yunnanense]